MLSVLVFLGIAAFVSSQSVQIIQDYSGKYRFTILDANDVSLLTSVTSYDTRKACVGDVAKAITLGKDKANFGADPRTVTERYSTTTFHVLELKDGDKVVCESSNIEPRADVDKVRDSTIAICSAATPPPVLKEDSTELRVGKFEIFQDIVGEYRFRLKAGNGEIILASEGYTRKGSAYTGIRSVKKNSIEEAQFKLEKSSADQPYFNLVAKNNEIIGTSEMYSSTSARQTGIDSVMRNAALAPIVDLTYGKPALGKPVIEEYQSEYGDYSWRLTGADKTVTLVQGYESATKDALRKSIEDFKAASADAANYQTETARLAYGPVRERLVIVTGGGSYTAPTALGFTDFGPTTTLEEIKKAVTSLNYNTIKTDTQFSTRSSRFTVFCGKDDTGAENGRYYFHLQAANYEIVLASQSYASKQSAKAAIKSVRTNAMDESKFDKRDSKDGQFYFVLKAGNGKVIGVSETYVSKSNRDAGIKSVMRNSLNAVEEVRDLTSGSCEAVPTYPDPCEDIYAPAGCFVAEPARPDVGYRMDGSSASTVAASLVAAVVAVVALL